MRTRRFYCQVRAVSFYSLLAASSLSTAYQYTMSDLPFPSGMAGVATGLNNSGDICGFAVNLNTYNRIGFMLSNNQFTDIGSLGKGIVDVGRMSNNGYITGYSNTNYPYIPDQHAFRYKDGQIEDLGTLGGSTSVGRDVNDNGVVVGESFTSSGYIRAFAYINGSMVNLGLLGGQESRAYAVNNLGQVVGYTDAVGCHESFIYQNGKMESFGATGAFTSCATDINDKGQIAGYSDGYYTNTVAYVYTPGIGVQYLGEHAININSYCSAINNNGVAVGAVSTLLGDYHGFVSYENKIVDINPLVIGLPDDSFITECISINDSGQILAYLNPSSPYELEKFVLLTPVAVPEPATALTISIGLLVALRRRKK